MYKTWPVSNHLYRKLLHTVDFKKLCRPLEALFCKDIGREGYRIESRVAPFSITADGRFEKPRTRAVFAKENNVGKFFCGFSLLDKDIGSHLLFHT